MYLSYVIYTYSTYNLSYFCFKRVLRVTFNYVIIFQWFSEFLYFRSKFFFSSITWNFFQIYTIRFKIYTSDIGRFRVGIRVFPRTNGILLSQSSLFDFLLLQNFRYICHAYVFIICSLEFSSQKFNFFHR